MNNPYVSLLGKSWKYSGDQKKKFLLIYFLFVLANIVFAINPLFYGWFINSIQQDGMEVIRYAWIYGLGFLGLRLAEWSFHGPARVMERKLAFQIGRNYLNELFHQVLHLPVNWHQNNHSGTIINRQRKAFEALRNFFQNGFTHLHAFGKFFFSFAAMLYFSPFYGMIGVAIGAFTVWVIFKFDKPFIRSIRDCNEKEHKMYSTLFDSLSNIVTVITLRLEQRMEKSLDLKVEEVLPSWTRKVTINEVKWFFAQMLVGIIYTVVTIGYIHEHYVAGQVFLIGGLITLLGYVNQFTSVFNDVAAQYTQLVQYNTDIMAVEEIQQAYRTQHRPESKQDLPAQWNNLGISNLNFTRTRVTGDNRSTGNLNQVRINLSKGKKVALIGESGGGKSTLLSLLRGLYNPDQGVQVSVDGQPVNFNGIPNSVTLFPQEPEIFENTIRYNITLGLPFPEEEVLEVCENSRFSEVIAQLPNGLETNIQEKGVNLSGGQKQRLALARGILAARSSSIVLFDEPTSSIDPRTEMLIYDRLFSTFADKAMVSSLHRLHLLPKFDYIYILRNGSIIDEGTFNSLLESSEVFNELWKHQKEHTIPRLAGPEVSLAV
jgi:ABC-type multidrug transport system fused ATPase/permease subunit